MTGAATLTRTAAEAKPEGRESIGARLVEAAAELGEGSESVAIERAQEAIASLEGAARLHDGVLDAGAAHGAARPDADPPTEAIAGAWLLGMGSEQVAACGDGSAAEWARAVRALVRAQMIEFEDLYDAGRSPDRALAVATSRTGTRMALAGRLGSMLSGAPPTVVDAAGRFGSELGVAVEIGDEIAALRSTAGSAGSRPGLGAGRYPVALLYALQADPDLARRLGRPLADQEIAAVVEAIEAAGGFARAGDERRARLAQARSALDGQRAAKLLALADELEESR